MKRIKKATAPTDYRRVGMRGQSGKNGVMDENPYAAPPPIPVARPMWQRWLRMLFPRANRLVPVLINSFNLTFLWIFRPTVPGWTVQCMATHDDLGSGRHGPLLA